METPTHIREKVSALPHQPGVYLMKDTMGGIIYVGKAKDLKRRVSSYFMPSRKMTSNVKVRALIHSIGDFEFHTVRNESESLILESKLIKQYRPRYNVALRDDKRFYLLRINLHDTFPKFSLIRSKKEDGAKYFGPFPHAQALKETLDWINRHFQLRTCRAIQPDESDYKHCNADIIRSCSAPCVQNVSIEEYKQRVSEACSLLEGKNKKAVLEPLHLQMQQAAETMDFEAAARFRDIIQNIEKTLIPSRQFARGRGVPTTIRPLEALEELKQYLNLPQAPAIMECFDISNISDNHIVASMVRFQDGVPSNQLYRRYRIKSVEGQNDFASMAEVIRRRYHFFKTKNHQHLSLPDLIIVDGGKGQLSSALTELESLEMSHIPIIGLAKQREEIFIPHQSEPILIPHDRGALRLLQRIRDEAHRFANQYNELLYRKRMKESLLDDIAGITTSKKLALLQHFGSINAIKQANLNELAAVSGISKVTAQNIIDHFTRGSDMK